MLSNSGTNYIIDRVVHTDTDDIGMIRTDERAYMSWISEITRDREI
jgi:hypothetical protein